MRRVQTGSTPKAVPTALGVDPATLATWVKRLTKNLTFGAWPTVFGEVRMTTALFDRRIPRRDILETAKDGCWPTPERFKFGL